jgi:hypothetical protein
MGTPKKPSSAASTHSKKIVKLLWHKKLLYSQFSPVGVKNQKMWVFRGSLMIKDEKSGSNTFAGIEF